MDEWVRLTTVSDLSSNGGKLFRHGEKRIAVFRLPAGVFAVDNRCPHQGYALVKGDVRDTTLTCAWHNWKFDLTSGACTFGGEAVRSYPVQVRAGGEVWVDVLDPPTEQVAPQLFASLLDAMGNVDIGRVARDTLRLRKLGTPLAEIVREGVRYGAPRAEYGWNHSLATLTDCLQLATMLDGPLSSLPVVQGLSVVSETEVRRPHRPRPDPIDPVAEHGSVEEALRIFPRLVDAERAEEAEGLLRGLIAAGVPPGRIRHMLLEAITDHFLGYGHPLIYCQKAFELLERIGWGEADGVLGPLVPNMTLSTRYDRLPYMRRFLGAWHAAEIDLTGLLRGGGHGPFDSQAYRRALLDGGPEDAVQALHRALVDGVPVPVLIDATVAAAAERLGRFNIDLDGDDSNEWGWLDVTHTLTYAAALRWAWTNDPTPEVLRGLFHAAWFVQWTGQLDAPDPVARAAPHATTDAAQVQAAVVKRDPEAAVALVHGYNGPAAALETALGHAAAADTGIAPIMVAHTVKTTQAAIVESRTLPPASARLPLAAAARFLAAPRRERFVYQATLEAIAFVEGRAKSE